MPNSWSMKIDGPYSASKEFSSNVDFLLNFQVQYLEETVLFEM